MFFKYFIIFLFFVSVVNAADMAGQLSTNAEKAYNTLVSLTKGLKWILAILPVVGIVMSILSDIQKLKDKAEQQVQVQEKVRGEDVFLIMLHLVVLMVGFFLIYGIFGMTYANAGSMGEVWNKVVFSFWASILTYSP